MTSSGAPGSSDENTMSEPTRILLSASRRTVIGREIVAFARQQLHRRAIFQRENAIAVELRFVQPLVTCRQRIDKRRGHRLNESHAHEPSLTDGRKFMACDHRIVAKNLCCDA